MALIEVRNLVKIYSDAEVETPALRGVSFSISEGEFVAVMGPSGSGKSTLLHILGFLDRPTKGEYRFEGKTIDEFSDEELARIRNKKFGFVFQNFNLLPRTNTLENVKLPLLYSGLKASIQEELAKKAIEAVGMSHRIFHQPSQLSGGERQRVAIARAIVQNPKVIFADEPTGNLDSKSGEQIMKIFQVLNKQGHTILLVTHETYTAQYAQRILKMKDGKIEKDFKVANQRLIEKDGFIK
ncbi:MAG: macrolide ABC transporter ATP-binding protein [Candidatus Nealsonbacteria bacterium]|nr:MAG: macrolide ABC transporter ATP-binding protein [Candidatus Nealsonbacteria bacterium]